MNAGGIVRNPEQPKQEINLVPTPLGTKSACNNNNSSAVGFDALTSREHRKIFPAQTQTHPRSPVVCNPVTTLRTARPCNKANSGLGTRSLNSDVGAWARGKKKRKLSDFHYYAAMRATYRFEKSRLQG